MTSQCKLDSNSEFRYEEAFSRNLGWVTEREIGVLKRAKVGIAGLGGVGGSHLLTLVRLGIENYHLADFDTFELPNFNRQIGANLYSLGEPKIEVMTAQALAINPHLNVRKFPTGVNSENVDDFLSDIDVFVDGLDVFAIEIRKLIFSKARALGIPCITVAPLGMGAACLNFLPDSMPFADYFGFSSKAKPEDLLRFLIGLSPKRLQLKSLIDLKFVNLPLMKVPSTPMGCFLASGVLGTEVLKIILNREGILSSPWSAHLDAYTYKSVKYKLWWGSKNPLFQIQLHLAKKRIRDLRSPNSPIEEVDSPR